MSQITIEHVIAELQQKFPRAIPQVMAALKTGDDKYGLNAWRTDRRPLGDKIRDHADGAQRHIQRHTGNYCSRGDCPDAGYPEHFDHESSLPALAHVAARALIALELFQMKQDMDTAAARGNQPGAEEAARLSAAVRARYGRMARSPSQWPAAEIRSALAELLAFYDLYESEVTTLRAQLAEARKDTERMDWLEARVESDEHVGLNFTEHWTEIDFLEDPPESGDRASAPAPRRREFWLRDDERECGPTLRAAIDLAAVHPTEENRS